jgi:hypothetical protein
MVSAAILDGPYPDTRREGDAWCHQGAQRGCESPPRTMGIRGAIKADRGDAGCQQGARWSRGRPESPHKSTCSSTRRWRCRPARPPTSRNPALRDAPPRSFRTPLRPQKPPIPTRRSDADRRSPPVCDPTTSDSHAERRFAPVCGPTTIVSHPDDPTKPPTPTPMLTTLSPQCGAFTRAWYQLTPSSPPSPSSTQTRRATPRPPPARRPCNRGCRPARARRTR